MNSRIRLHLGDITQLDCEAIVTAANEALIGGGGVDGAVHDAAGLELVRASKALAPCPAGQAKITDGFQLSKFVIHAVGPIYNSLDVDRQTLANTYLSSLSLARKNNVKTIAFPCISTGVYGFPAQAACEIAIDTVVDWIASNELPEVVTFCCYSKNDYDRYADRLEI